MSAYKDAQANNDISRNVKQYRDLDLFFTKKSNKDVNKVTDIEAVKRSVRNLVLLNHYEKPFHPEIGSGIRDMLFENMSSITAFVLSKKIEDVIENFEPRVNNIGVDVFPSPDENTFEVTISYDIIGQSFPTQEYTFLLEATRY